jgi:hypothetical protein
MVVQRRFVDSGGIGDLLHRNGIESPGHKERPGFQQNAMASFDRFFNNASFFIGDDHRFSSGGTIGC